MPKGIRTVWTCLPLRRPVSRNDASVQISRTEEKRNSKDGDFFPPCVGLERARLGKDRLAVLPLSSGDDATNSLIGIHLRGTTGRLIYREGKFVMESLARKSQLREDGEIDACHVEYWGMASTHFCDLRERVKKLSLPEGEERRRKRVANKLCHFEIWLRSR